jgi:hypothetical protein
MTFGRYTLTAQVTMPWPATWSEIIQGAANVPVATPAIPASTVAEANGAGVDVAVTVTGGTVTAINVGSNAANLTATGLTSGTVIVRDGYAVSVTYSAAPTWAWSAAQMPQSGSSSMTAAVSGTAPAAGQAGVIPQFTWFAGQGLWLDTNGQLYAALNTAGAGLRAWIDGQDSVGRPGISN